MSDFGSPVVTAPAPLNPLQTLSQLMGIKQQRQTLETGEATQQSAQATAQQDQQTAQQRSGIAKFMAGFDPSKHVGKDGTLNLDNVLTDPALREAAGDQFPQVIQQMIAAKQGQLTAKQQLADLNGKLRNQFSSTVGSLRTDPDVIDDDPKTGMGRAKVNQAIENFAESGGDDARRVADTYGNVIKNVPNGKLVGALSNFQLQAMDASAQAGKQSPNLADTGGALQDINPQSAGGKLAGQPTIQKGVAPGASIVTDANQHQFVLDPKSNTLAPVGAGRTGAPSALKYRQGTNDADTVRASIEGARQAGDVSGLNQHINDQLMRLSNDTSTGYGTDKWHSAIGALSGGKFGSDYQTIGGYLDRQASMASKSMGLPDTNAGLATAQSLSGNTGYSPEALQTKVKLADTLNTAARQFRQGLDNTVGVGPNQDNGKYQAYRSAWAASFDPQVFAAENALRRGDKGELAKIQQQEGPQGMAALAKKRQALTDLAAGKMPQ